MREEAPKSPIGGRVRRGDAEEKVTGRARYAGDYVAPGMLFGKIVRSERAHAWIVRIDAAAARALPGVEAVICGEAGCDRFGEVVKDQTPFATDRVRYAGEPIAAIAAESELIAELAAGMLEIEYDDLRAVFDPAEALLAEAPLVHDD